MTVEQAWGLSRPPFAGSLDPDLFFPAEDHTEALARLEFLARDDGTQLGLLTGELGCGKSLTRVVFASRSAATRRVAQVTSSHYPFPELLHSILTQLGVAEAGDRDEGRMMRSLERVLAAGRWPTVLLFDEAQELDHHALVGVRALTNLGEGRYDLTVVLVGQPELRSRILALPQLDQRAGLRYHLRPFWTEEVGQYLSFRLRAAGHPDGRLFGDGAVAAIAAGSRGIPREINRIARLALTVAAKRGAATVSESHVSTVVADLAEQRGTV